MDDADEALLDEQISGLASRNIVSKPSRCPQDRKLFEDWRFDLENFMSVVHSDYGQEMNDALSTNLAEGEDLGHGEAGSGIRKRSILLYGVLAGLTSGRTKLMVKKIRSSRNGYLAWRMLVEDFMPRQSTNLKLALSMEISSGEASKVNHDFHTALLQWEEKITLYETFGTLFDDTIKRGVLLANAPLEVATHLRVTEGATENYDRMKIAIELYF